MININKLLDVAYAELEQSEITKLIELKISIFGYTPEELDELYDIFYNKCPHVGRKFDSVISKVRQQLKQSDVFGLICHPFCNMLLNLKNSKFEIDDILRELDYEERIDDLYQELKPRFFKDEKIDINDWDIIETRLSQVYNDYELAEKVLLRCLNRGLILNFESICDAAMTFVKKQITDALGDNNISVLISPVTKAGGRKITGVVEMPTSDYLEVATDILKYHYAGKGTDFYNVVFHEIRHFEQDRIAQEKSAYIDAHQINLIKELVVTNHLYAEHDTYYDDNYDCLFNEADAKYYGEKRCIEYLKSHGIEAYDISYKFIPANEVTTKRIYKGQETTLHRLFDSIIQNHPEDLEKYPSLKYLYKLQDGEVIKKTIQELENDIKNIMSSSDMSGEDKQKLIDSYSEYINNLIEKNNIDYDQQLTEAPTSSGRKSGFIDIFVVLAIVTITCITGVILGFVITNL